MTPSSDMPGPQHPSRTAAEWDESFALFNASSELTQRAFCDLHGLSHCAFRYRYRLSSRFLGKRRRTSADVDVAAVAASTSSFRPVSLSRSSAADAPTGAPSVIVRVNDGIAVECHAGADPTTVATLVRELLR